VIISLILPKNNSRERILQLMAFWDGKKGEKLT